MKTKVPETRKEGRRVYYDRRKELEAGPPEMSRTGRKVAEWIWEYDERIVVTQLYRRGYIPRHLRDRLQTPSWQFPAEDRWVQWVSSKFIITWKRGFLSSWFLGGRGKRRRFRATRHPSNLWRTTEKALIDTLARRFPHVKERGAVHAAIRQAAYPASVNVDEGHWEVCREYITKAMRHSRPEDVCRELFGKRRTCPSLIRGVAAALKQGAVWRLKSAWELRTRLKREQLVRVLYEGTPGWFAASQDTSHRRFRREFARYLTSERLVRLLCDKEASPSLQMDTAYMWRRLGEPILIQRQRTWQEMHDQLLYLQQQREAVQREERMKYYRSLGIDQEPYRGIDGYVLHSGHRMVTPKTIADIMEWAQVMNHCSAVYTESITQGNHLFIEVMDGETHKATAVVYLAQAKKTPGVFDQCPGPNNCRIDDDLLGEIEAALFDHKLI